MNNGNNMIYNKYDLLADRVYRMLKEQEGKIVDPYIPLYHGSQDKRFNPEFGKGKNKHDYGAGLYTTLSLDLAKEWAVCSGVSDGYVHKYVLETKNLNILNFNDLLDDKECGQIGPEDSIGGKNDPAVLTWLATLTYHRSAGKSALYRINAAKLIEKYYDPRIEEFDVVIGYRADDSYFSFAKNILTGNANVNLLDRMLSAGNLGDQIFIQSKRAFDNLHEIEMNSEGYFMKADYSTYRPLYQARDDQGRKYVATILNDISINDLSDSISKYI